MNEFSCVRQVGATRYIPYMRLDVTVVVRRRVWHLGSNALRSLCLDSPTLAVSSRVSLPCCCMRMLFIYTKRSLLRLSIDGQKNALGSSSVTIEEHVGQFGHILLVI